MRKTIIDSRKEGDERVKETFLFFPKCIDNQIRWLEKAKIKQSIHYMFDPTCGASWWEWRDLEWIDNIK